MHLSIQATQAPPLIWEGPTPHAAEPGLYSPGAAAPEAHEPLSLGPTGGEATTMRSPRPAATEQPPPQQLELSLSSNKDPVQTKLNKYTNLFFQSTCEILSQTKIKKNEH